MSSLARRWLYALVVLAAVDTLVFGTSIVVADAQMAIGQLAGSLFAGGFCGWILNIFWEKYGFYELWFASSAIWFSTAIMNKMLGVY